MEVRDFLLYGLGRTLLRRAAPAAPAAPLVTYDDYILADPSTVAYWKMNEAAGSPNLIDAIAARNAVIVSSGVGVILGQTGLIPGEADTAARFATSGVARLAAIDEDAFDNDGTIAVSMMAIITPNILRSGSSINYNIFSKVDRITPFSGYEWSLRWSQPLLKTIFGNWLMQQTTGTNAIDVSTTPDIDNTRHHLGFSYSGNRNASGLLLYVDGFAQTKSITTNNLTGSPSNPIRPTIGARYDGSAGQFWAKDDREKVSYHTGAKPQWEFARAAALAHGRDLVVDPAAFPVALMLDSDNDTDCGDPAAVAIAVAKHVAGRCSIKCATISSTNDYSAACMRVLLDHKGLTAVPVGARQGGSPTVSSYTQGVCNAFGHAGDVRTNYPAAVTVMRTALAALPDGGKVNLVVIGGLTNISALMQSAGDGIHALDGNALMMLKGVTLFTQLFNWPGGSEWNALLDVTATDYVFANWLGPVVNTDYDVGNLVDSGPTGSGASNPYQLVFDLDPNDVANKRKSWDAIAVHTAIEGRAAGLYEYHLHNGKVTVSAGAGTWSFLPAAGHSDLMLRASGAAVGAELDALIATMTP